MPTTNITVYQEWALVTAGADTALLSAVSGYGEICESTGTPDRSLKGHYIAAGKEGPAYQVSGDIYARASPGSNSLVLALT
ncbi:hypothetical protein ABU178_08435 [Pantoea osteomyelitidis]|uniref:Uncharacterized protein n=1 Tax=Pantoea osteomyelitidis TaxID=3230026 RepID=A0ABW7PWG0_9GAMM